MSGEGLDVMLQLATALAAGFVIGAEREQGEHATFAGIRTFPLIGLTGALGALLGPWALAVMGLGVAALVGLAYRRSAPRDAGTSTEIAALVTFGLGAVCTAESLPLGRTDRLLVVAAGATGTLALLSVKQPLHRWVAKVSEADVFATTKLLVLAVIVLPLLPNRELGPWSALNPRSIGILVVLISAIGFAGYVAIRAFGARRGFGLTGLLGGLASSTAVTLTFSGRAKEAPKLLGACAVAIVLASATMFPRVVVEVWAVSGPLAETALWAFAAAGATALVAAILLYLRAGRADPDEGDTELELDNPFSLKSAFKFTLLFLVVLLVSKGASEEFADAGVYVSAFLAGLADVDAISLSIARLHEGGGIGREPALWALAIASATNSLAKVGIAAVLGGARLGLYVGVPIVLALASA
ncbi:MAG TPA: MgtC/SapB family protein, partial [Polyangiaceae bacterium LLY-WYZ-15_(1-7)]|nr:MgtC/SapB family protein [Polyangiaceae bacterium LLY-WYZ-15_(1-7)]